MFIEKAYKAKHEFWRYIIGLVGIIAAVLIGQIPWTIVLIVKEGFEVLQMNKAEMLGALDSNLNLFLLLLSFLCGLGALFLVVRFLHGQKIKDLTTTRKKIDWGRFFFGFSLIAIYIIVSTGVDYYYFNPDHYVLNFELIPFLVLCVIAIVMIPIQTSFEEYLFRGYLMQGIGVTAKNRWFPLVVTSVIFGCLHLGNPEIDQLGYLSLFDYIAFGFLFGIITLMDEGMELSLGLHAGNNFVIALLVTADWTAFQTHSILKDVSAPTSYTGTDVLITVLFFSAVILIMAKKYHWKNWREKLFGKLDPIDENENLNQN